MFFRSTSHIGRASFFNRGVAQLAARLLWEQEDASSSLAVPTRVLSVTGRVKGLHSGPERLRALASTLRFCRSETAVQASLVPFESAAPAIFMRMTHIGLGDGLQNRHNAGSIPAVRALE